MRFGGSIWMVAVVAFLSISLPGRGQVFTVGEKSATADINVDFSPTRVELPGGQLNERGRRELMRDLEAEQGFAHLVLPVAANLTLLANGKLTPQPDAYKKLVYEKGQFANPGDRVAITALEVKGDKITIDLNGGPYVKHRFLRHIQIGVGGVDTVGPNLNDGEKATGCRITLVFEGGIPDISAPEVKALLYPLVDFGVKTGAQAYVDTLPAPVKRAVATHQVLVGMNREMVLASMGAPASKVRETNEADERYEEWIYGHQPQTVRFVRFVGDRVTLVKVAKLGQPMEIHDQDEMVGYASGPPTRAIAEGDATPVDRKKNAPTLKQAGETLPDEGLGIGNQNGKVQYPVDKKAPADGQATTAPAANPPQSGPTHIRFRVDFRGSLGSRQL